MQKLVLNFVHHKPYFELITLSIVRQVLGTLEGNY